MQIELLPGLPLGDLVRSLVILLVGFVAAWFVYPLARGVAKRITAKTKTNLDDLLIEALERPVFLAIVLIAIAIALEALPIIQGYQAIFRKAVGAAAVLLGVYTGIRVANAVIAWYGKEVADRTKSTIDDNLLPLIRRLVTGVILALGALFLLNQLGINITPLLAGLGIGGLAVALAFQNTMSNFFAGTNIATDGSLKVGDFIQLESGLQGTVTEIAWRSTRITTRTNNVVIIPNSKLAESIVTNYSIPSPEVGFVVNCGVAYGSDLEKVERVTIEVATKLQTEHHGAVSGAAPAFVYMKFGDSNIEFIVFMRAKGYGEQFSLTHDFIKALTKRYDEEGIEISWPVRKVHMYAHTDGGAGTTGAAAASRADGGTK
jgi:small-conductance mechanosensitive channel